MRSGRRPPVAKAWSSRRVADREPAAEALVGERGVDVTGVEDHEPGGEGRFDDLGDELRAGGAEQEGIGTRVVGGVARGVVEDDVADLLADRGAARLPGDEDAQAARLEGGAEALGDERLARPIRPLDGDEPAA